LVVVGENYNQSVNRSFFKYPFLKLCAISRTLSLHGVLLGLIAPDDFRFEGQTAKPGNFQIELARLGKQLPVIAPAPSVQPVRRRPLIAARIADGIRFRIQQSVQGALDGPSHQPVNVVLNLFSSILMAQEIAFFVSCATYSMTCSPFDWLFGRKQ